MTPFSPNSVGAVEDIQFKSKDAPIFMGLMVKPASFVAGRRSPPFCGFTADPTAR